MAKFDARSARSPLDATDLLAVELALPTGHVSHSATSYLYNSRGGDRVALTGTGIKTGSNNNPTAGQITKVTIDLNRNTSIDATITGSGVPITSLTASPDSFWSTLLKGNDVIYAPATQAAILFGDAFRTVGQTSIKGGNDSFVGGTSQGQTFYGDVVHVGNLNSPSYGRLTGGDDTVVANNIRSFSVIYGDAADSEGETTGGDDRLTGSATRADTIIGDVGTQQDGFTIGGDDTIGGRGGNDTLIGDCKTVAHFPGGTASSEGVGGNDAIRGGDGNDMIFGDFDFVALLDVGANNFASGGNDTIYGDAGNDTIIGDVTRDQDGIQRYGADKIYGGADNDTIYADYKTADASVIAALTDDDLLTYRAEAKDFADGGTGDDKIFGGYGCDRLLGNTGRDTIYGETGADLIVGGAGADIINGGINADRLYGDQGAPAAADRFIFDARAGNDRIFDFQNDVDQIEVSASYGFLLAADLVATATVNGGDVTLHLSATDSITLIGYNKAASTLEDDIVIF